MVSNPKLRAVDIQPVIFEGQQMWLLRDPLALTDSQLILTPALAQMAIFCDGTRDARQIQKDISSYFEIPVESDVVEHMLQKLDEACLFDNERSQALHEGHLADFRSLPFRAPALAGVSYPGDL